MQLDPAGAGSMGVAGAMAGDCRGIALIVDDEPTNCRLLSRMLKIEGFQTLEAYNGEQALELFAAERPDIVFMDVMMPGMDGFEATRRIKQMHDGEFIPVIFLTALRDEQSMVRCVEAGGDDFLSKPFSFGILKARIVAMERVRDLHRTIAANNRTLSALLDRDRAEQALAERVFSRAVKDRNVLTDRIGMIERPTTIFSGDLVLTQHLPDGGLRILVGDFTGHGLAAAIGALPVADVFHTMTIKGVSDAKTLAEINRKLYQMLPPDRFMAACLISVRGSGDELRWWNGGMPSAWLRTPTGVEELAPHALPLGILPELPEDALPRRLYLTGGERLLLLSDGLLEAADDQGRLFEETAFRDVLSGWFYDQSVLPRLFEALDRHCADIEHFDDVTAVEIPFGPELLAAPQNLCERTPAGGWRWSLELRDERLANVPSVDAALRPLGLLEGMDAHVGALETIVTELYSNALEHGVLRLPSQMKATPEGFAEYYLERGRRLADGCRGRVRLHLSYEPEAEGGLVRVRIADSGEGFDAGCSLPAVWDPARPWGRGIALVRDLCESVRFLANGSMVEAIYRW